MKTQKNKIEKTKKNKAVNATVFSLIVVSAIAVGVGGGFFLHNMLSGETVDDNQLDAASLYGDDSSLLPKYESAKKKGLSFKETFSPREMASVSLLLFAKQENSFSQGIGTSSPVSISMTQDIRDTSIRSGDQYFEESLSSSSFVHLANRMYQSGETTSLYKGDIGQDVEHGVYDVSDKVDYSNKDYATLMGRNLSTPCIYIISDKTVLTGDETNSGKKTSSAKNEDGTYGVELELNTDLACYNYKTQMKSISNLMSRPVFYYCHLSFSLDSSLNLTSMTSSEKYFAKTSAGVGSTCEGVMRTVFETGGSYSIPQLGESVGYREAM